MTRRHNTKHLRGRSNYKKRLADRGLSATPRMRWTGLDQNAIARALAEAAARANRKEET